MRYQGGWKTAPRTWDFYLGEMESFRKQKEREGRISWKGGSIGPGKVFWKNFFLGLPIGQPLDDLKGFNSASNSWVAQESLLLCFLWTSHLVTERNTHIKGDSNNTFLVWRQGRIITHVLPALRSSEPKCGH